MFKFLFTFSLCIPVIAQAYSAADWRALFKNGGGNAVFYGVDLAGPVPYAQNELSYLLPASAAKILTAAASLHYLGADFRYETKVSWKPVNASTIQELRLTGSGDPTWGMEEFGFSLTAKTEEIARRLKNQGIKNILGPVEIMATDPRWENLRFPAGWQANDKIECYGAIAQSFNVNINCARFSVSGLRSGKWIEEGVATKVNLALQPGEKTSLRLCGSGVGEKPATSYKICGTWKEGSAARIFILPIPDVNLWVKNLLHIALKKEEITLSKTEKPLDLPGISLAGFSLYSPPLAEMLKPFLKNSIGMMGEALFKTMGEKFTPSQELNAGGQSILREYAQAADIAIWDGSGLSRLNRMSPAFLYAFLEKLKTERYFPQVWDALAIAGVDGTLSKRMRNSIAMGRLRGKTGTLDGVYNLVGYVPDGSDFIPFVMLTRTTVEQAALARSTEDQAAIVLTRLLGSSNNSSYFMQENLTFSSTIPYIAAHAGLDAQ